jgi:hypothetical protein
MTFTIATDTPASIHGYGYVPTERRGIIHTTPAADRQIMIRALQGPARMGRKKRNA